MNKTLSNVRISYCLVVFLVIPIIGCAGWEQKPLVLKPGEDSIKISVVSNIANEEIATYLPRKDFFQDEERSFFNNLMNEGANTALAKAAKERVIPLREAAADLDYKTEFWQRLEKKLVNSTWFKAGQLKQLTRTSREEQISAVEPPVLFLNTFYVLSAASQILVMQTKAELFLNDMEKPDYYGYYTYYSDKIGKNKETDDTAILLWSLDNAAAYRSAVFEGIEFTMQMLDLDLLDQPAKQKNAKGEYLEVYIWDPFASANIAIGGRVLSGDMDRVIMRERSGKLLSVNPNIK
jgi:hypothetical protein